MPYAAAIFIDTLIAAAMPRHASSLMLIRHAAYFCCRHAMMPLLPLPPRHFVFSFMLR